MSNKIYNKVQQVFVGTGKQKILSELAFANDWLTSKEIQELTQVSKAAVHLLLDRLFQLNLLERDQKGKTYLYRINSDYPNSSLLKQFKILNNLTYLWPLIKQLIPLSQKVILFGSASRGEDYKDSDIDIFIVTHAGEEVKKLVKKYQTDRKIQIIVRRSIDFLKLERTDPIFYGEIKSGIILWEKEDHYAG